LTSGIYNDAINLALDLLLSGKYDFLVKTASFLFKLLIQALLSQDRFQFV